MTIFRKKIRILHVARLIWHVWPPGNLLNLTKLFHLFPTGSKNLWPTLTALSSNKRSLPPFLKGVNFNGEASNKRPSRCKEGERNDAYCYENGIFISIGSLQFWASFFSKRHLKWLYFSFISCSLSYNTLAIFPDSLRATYFPDHKANFSHDSSIGTCPTNSLFLFPEFVHFEINAPLN